MKILLGLVLFFSFFINVGAQNQANLFYDNFTKRLDTKNLSINEELKILDIFNSRITTFLNKSNNTNTKNLLNDLLILNKRQINLVQNQLTSNNDNNITNLSNIENQTPNELKDSNSSSNNNNKNLPNHIKELINLGFDYLEVNSKSEFNNEGNTFRITYTNFYRITNSNIRYFSNNYDEGYILKREGEYIFVPKSNLERKYTYDSLSDIFTNFLDFDNRFLQDKSRYYTYNYSRFVYFDDKYGVYLTDLNRNKIYPTSTLLIKKDGEYYFSNNYRKIDLVGKNILDGITNREEFLINLLDDNRFLEGDYDNELIEIKNKTREITRNHLTDDAKIYAIYKWVSGNVEYYHGYLDGNKKIYSGIYSFKNKSGVCDGYTKLFLYMLSFAGITDVEVIKGFAFDVPEFPDFGHAWVRIGDKYYDPTFDEQNVKNSRDFVYFGLPEKLMYVDRFDGFEIPNHLKVLSLSQRKNLSLKNLMDVSSDFGEYKITNKAKNYNFLNLSHNQTPTISLLKEKMPFFEVSEFEYQDAGTKKRIKNFRFYNISNDNIRNIILNAHADLSEFKLFYWKDDGTYKLSYDIEYH